MLFILILVKDTFCASLVIYPFMITMVLHSSGTFVRGNNTLSRKITS